MIPMFVVAILFTSLIAYSKLVEEKGAPLFKIYRDQLDDESQHISQVDNISELENRLKKIEFIFGGRTFIITPTGRN